MPKYRYRSRSYSIKYSGPFWSRSQSHINSVWISHKGPFTLSFSVNTAISLAILLSLNCLDFLINQANCSRNGLQPQLIIYNTRVETDTPDPVIDAWCKLSFTVTYLDGHRHFTFKYCLLFPNSLFTLTDPDSDYTGNNHCVAQVETKRTNSKRSQFFFFVQVP